MTEAEWLSCDDMNADVADLFLSGRFTDRKLRLFAIACCRKAWPWLDANERDAADFLDSFVEKSSTEADRVAIYDRMPPRSSSAALELLDRNARFSAAEALLLLFGDYHDHHEDKWNLLHDIFGNPFHPITFNPSWRTPKVVALAQKIYDNRAFNRLPDVADALEETGCENTEILAHCRGPGPHVRGCWVVDLILQGVTP